MSQLSPLWPLVLLASAWCPSSSIAEGPSFPATVSEADATAVELRLSCLFALDSDTVWVGGELEGRDSSFAGPALFTTDDGGASWAALDISSVAEDRRVVSLFFLDRLTGWAALVSQGPGGGEPAVIRTTDGGESWAVHELELPVPQAPSAAYQPVSLEFATPEVGLIRIVHTIVEDEEAVFVTTDGGRSWSFSHGRGASGHGGQRLSIAADATLWKLGGYCEACDPDAVFRSHDHGLAWQEVSSPRPAASP
ncbi:MAG: hypothetical protein MI919_03990 [Holophagales bacterium]|nr:hypothetical protein [Holophagales bacterium]